MSTMLLEMTRGRLEGVRRAAERWREEPRPPLAPMDAEGLVAECLGHPALLRRACRQTVDAVFGGAGLRPASEVLPRLNDARSALHALFEASEALLALAEQLARRQQEQTGRSVEGAERLTGAQEELLRLKDETLGHWDEFRPVSLDEVRAADARGEFLPVDEAFAAAMGVSVEELHRRLEEHKAKRQTYGWE
jgi:hypothetical protein